MTRADLERLETAVRRALQRGNAEGLEVVGYGEISLVLVLDTGQLRVAAKRLPLFPSQGAVSDYEACLTRYLARLEAAGIEPVPTRLQAIEVAGGRLAAYCLQPMLPPGSLGHELLVDCSAAEADALFAGVIDRAVGAVGPCLGVDAQISNWAMVDGSLEYLDVSTPLMRDDEGAEELDLELFIASLPWAVRRFVRRHLLSSVVDKYYDPRQCLRDVAANFHKEGLARWIPRFLELCNRQLERPLTEAGVARYYRGDALMWELLLRLRRADRWWQLQVRRRPYPFLLPGPITR
ncbi:MAG: hypothetical protein JRI68_22155 [Deltaproteobacteria bacterium]|nr:hypothetical protein [Deltaproteobacteria bacterium]